ncbi:GNAT family N-acetyltransferase, partial [Asanoa sp. NPDC050611]|uniref:GNAT family N-acetyltransferase n=1 Tax=Asanoa sp. NPDC050611 TaxID=3157098 RepID=UPI0033C1DFDB
MRTVTTERLLLRPWRADDADFLLDLESRWDVVRFLGPNPTAMSTREDALASIARRRAVDHPIHGIWAITTAGDGGLVGNLLLKPERRVAAAAGRGDQITQSRVGGEQLAHDRADH